MVNRVRMLRNQIHEHLVHVVKFHSYAHWFVYHSNEVLPWLQENISGRWAASFESGAAIYEFSDLQDATLFRLKF
jgi:hypothetical protein